MLPKAQIEFFETRADSGGSEQRHTAEDSSGRGHPQVAPGNGKGDYYLTVAQQAHSSAYT